MTDSPHFRKGTSRFLLQHHPAISTGVVNNSKRS